MFSSLLRSRLIRKALGLALLGGVFGAVAAPEANATTPFIDAIGPSSVKVNTPSVLISIAGGNFNSQSVATFNNIALDTFYLDNNLIFAKIPSSLLTTVQIAQIRVKRPVLGGLVTLTSQPKDFQVFDIPVPPQQPPVNVPTLTGLSQSSIVAGSAGFVLTVTGTNFENGAVVRWNGSNRATSFNSSQSLNVTVTDADIASPGLAMISVKNPSNALAVSNSLVFVVAKPADVVPTPSITSLNPNNVVEDGPSFSMLITGSDFQPGATAYLNGIPYGTAYLNANQVLVAVDSSLVADPGAVFVQVSNPLGSPSNTLALTVEVNLNPAITPTLLGLSPNSKDAGSPAFILDVTGTNFVEGAKIIFNGVVLPTTFIDSTHLQGAVSGELIANPGFANVLVLNPDPEGGNGNEGGELLAAARAAGIQLASNSFLFVITQPVYPNQNPFFSVEPSLAPNPVYVGDLVSYSAGATDPEGKAVFTFWNYGDGQTGYGTSTQHAYAAPGTYSVTVQLVDVDGGTANHTLSVTVLPRPSNQVPVLQSSISATPNPASTGEGVIFTAVATDPEGGELKYQWFYGDGATSLGAQTVHAYTAPGVYDVTVEITDPQGAKITSTIQVTVIAAAIPEVPGQLTFGKATLKALIPSKGRDYIQYRGFFDLPEGVTKLDGPFSISIGGVSASFNLKRGSGRIAGGSSVRLLFSGARYKQASESVFLRGTLRGDLLTALQNAGFTGAAGTVSLPVTISFAGKNYSGVIEVTLKPSKSGTSVTGKK